MSRTTRNTGNTAPQPSGSNTTVTAQPQGSTPSGRNTPTDNTPPTAGTGNTPVRPYIPGKFELPILNNDGSNYELWPRAVTLALRNRELWHIVNGTETSSDMTTDAAAHDDWCLKGQDTQLTIILALKKVRQQCVYPAQTVKDTLKARYSDGGDRRRAFLLEQVLKATFTDTEPLKPQLDRVICVNHQLEAAKVDNGSLHRTPPP